jgi:acetyl-CoA C-acetyltransferase
MVVNNFARRISRGECGSVLIAGAEAFRSRRRASKAGVELPWTRDGGPPTRSGGLLGDDRGGVSELEQRHGLFLPPHIYPLFENALRARLGRGLEEHRQHLGRLYERFSQIAAGNPFAWFPKERNAREIVSATRTNRMIAYPYTKYLNAVMEVDQGAAVLMTSVERARALGISEDRFVHPLGAGDALEEPWFLSERPRLDRCPGQSLAIERALAMAGVGADEIDVFDLYSCFPVAVEMACEALGMEDDDPRPLTVTGGLAYGGGPGNNYSLHGIAGVMQHLRKHGGLGLVTALGWYMTKHSVGVYGAEPPTRPPAPAPRREPVEALVPVEAPEGKGVVETYTVFHDREGTPERGVVLGRDAENRRFVANTPTDRALLEDMESREMVGQGGRLSSENGLGRFAPD